MINSKIVHKVDEWLDSKVGDWYKDQPLAQDWARIAKVQEELGEVIAEWILYTGQNPRKPQDDEALDRMLRELADTAMTAIYAIQHFTKSEQTTRWYVKEAQAKHESRVDQ